MRNIFVLTQNFLREMIRDRTISIVFFSSIFLLILSSLLGSLSLDEQRRILIHLGLASVHWTALGLVLFQGGFVLQREIDRQTCLMVLARPVSRPEFLLSKFFGVAILVLGHFVVQGGLLYGLLQLTSERGTPASHFVISLVAMWIESLVILSFVLFVAQWVRPVVAAFAGLGLSLVGSWLEEMSFLVTRQKDEGLRVLSQVFHWIFPNFYLLNFRSERFLDSPQLNEPVLLLGLHFSVWLMLFLGLAIFSFRRRDLV